MSESSPWQSPSGPNPSQSGATPPTPPSGQAPPPPPPPGFPPPPPGWAGPPPGWTPPPRPGLIPLQPMTLGTILGAAFRVLRRNPRPTFGLALLVEGITLVASVVVVGLVFGFAFSRITNATSAADASTIANGSLGLVLLAYLVPITLGVFGTAITQGVFSLEVARGTVGEKLTLGGLWRRSRGRMGALIGWFWALIGGGLVAYIILVLLVTLAVVLGGVVGAVVGILFGILLFLGAAVLVVWLAPKLSMVPAVLMLERLPLRRAIARSWTLTRGYYWRTLGIELLVVLIVNAATSVVTAPLEIVFVAIAGVFNQTGNQGTAIIVSVIVGIVGLVIIVVLSAVSTVVQSSTTALLYLDLRIRKEALDLDLIRFVEARQAGDDSVPDPYLAPVAGVPVGGVPVAIVPPPPPVA